MNVVIRCLVVTALLAAAGGTASAGGPRWVSGPPYFNNWHVLISWYTNRPAYYTDPGDLSPSVTHAAADAMVAKAASVWNIQTASLVLTQGGNLNEHISGANVYASLNGPVFPADVQTTNYAAKQIAVIYDSDGSVTDLLLGSGASDPSGCRESAVTESVDSITPEAHIQHAILILNGLCTGPRPEQQTQMQYQLMRAFGRILGLGWSQTNDNVFTGTPSPTHMQAMNWPIMHPIDIICGLYGYQCLPEPFTLRPDDISALEQLYFIRDGEAPPGKLASWSNAGSAYGRMTFPSGQGMEGVNVVVRREAPFWDQPEEWQTASSVTGYTFRGQGTTSIATPSSSPGASMGVYYGEWEGYWRIQSIPVPQDQGATQLVITTEPINPLYTGPYAIGPQAENTISPSGTAPVRMSYWIVNGRENEENFTPPDAATSCGDPNDGSEGAPAPVVQGGWWNGMLCAYHHSAWSSLQVKANRTLTLEVTALDEKGLVTMTKALPVVGVWNAADATGTLPTIAVVATPFNSFSVGMTTLKVQSTTAASLRIDIEDQRGSGRPDFAYQARALYADAIVPANVAAGGGTVVITGMGFRLGNAVLVNGVAANVTSWSQSSITAVVPSLHSMGLSRGTVASVTVQDLSTGGTSVMSGALTYANPVETLQLVSAPSGSLTTGIAAAKSFSVQAIAPNGYTPIVGETISFSASGAGARLGPCLSLPCSMLTNSLGIASAYVTPISPGKITLTAIGRSGTASATFTATSAADLLQLLSAPSGVVTTGAPAVSPLRMQVLLSDGVTPHAGSVITLSVLTGSARLGSCSTSPCSLTSDASGVVATTVIPISNGTITVQLSSSTNSVTASFTSAAETMRLISAPSATQTVGAATSPSFSVKVFAGDGFTPVVGEAVVFTATSGAVSFGACGGAVCSLTTDAQGTALSPVTPTAAGNVTLNAIGMAGSVTSTFTAVDPPGVLRIVSAPAGTVYLGAAMPAFVVRITALDGITPLIGRPVTFSASAGTVNFGACGSTVCIALTDSSGFVSTPVVVSAPGDVVLVATADAALGTATFTAAVRVRSVTAAKPVQYVAEGSKVTWSAQVKLADNSAPTSGVQVSWTGTPGLSFSAQATFSTDDGLGAGKVTAGPMVGGSRAQGYVCAWASICSPIIAQAVAAAEWRLSIVSGAQQSVSTSNGFEVVVLRATNVEGDPIAGVLVQIDQIVSGWTAACPDAGRCPVAATITSTNMSQISDEDGLVRILPAQADGTPAITTLAAIAGPAGFASLSLDAHP